MSTNELSLENYTRKRHGGTLGQFKGGMESCWT